MPDELRGETVDSRTPNSQAVGAPPYKLRPATMRESAFLYDLRAMTMKAQVEQIPGWSPEMREAYYLDFDPKVHQIIVIDGKNAGAVSVIDRGTEVYISNLHLLPEYQGRGLGTRILGDLMRQAASQGVPLTAQAFKRNTASLKMLERLGYVVTGETDLRYQLTYSAHLPQALPSAGIAPGSAPPPLKADSPVKSLRNARRKAVDSP